MLFFGTFEFFNVHNMHYLDFILYIIYVGASLLIKDLGYISSRYVIVRVTESKYRCRCNFAGY